jgi:glutathione-disulfide reductase
MNTKFDVIILGGGSGGLAVAERAVSYGQSVAVIDGSALGGTCVNRGCVPKKVMWYAANLAHAAHDASEYGIKTHISGMDWSRLVAGRQQYVTDINHYWANYVKELGITHIQGYATLKSHTEVAVGDQIYHAKHIVLATGSRPIVPPVPGAELGITSDGFFELNHWPKKVAMIGAGYIGIELTGILQAFGAQVTVIGLEARPLELFDEGLSTVLAETLTQQGVELRLGFMVTALSQQDSGIRVSSKDGQHLDGFDAVIWAVGRRPNTDNLGLAEIGITPLRSGVIETDLYQNTVVPNIYAVGDIAGRSPLTPVAVAAGRRLADRLFDGQANAKIDYDLIPTVVFAHPPIGCIGLNETQAKALNTVVTVYETAFTPMRYALNKKGNRTWMKLICAGETEKVIGLHVMGEGADEMLQGFAVAIKMGATKADFDRTIPIHPSSAEEFVTLKRPDRVYYPKIGS